MVTSQVAFLSIGEDAIQGGILVSECNNPIENDKLIEGYIICGCCGGIFEPEDVESVTEYKNWVDISAEIIGT